jgi:hypothetical protein
MSCAEPKMKKPKVEDTDDAVEENENENEKHQEVDEEEEEEEPQEDKILKNDNGESYFDISAKKRVTVRKWNGNVLVDIREVRWLVGWLVYLFV